jgi:hypothetical protein
VALAKKYHITVIPSINVPGHIGPFLINHPDLQLTDRDGNKSLGHLDITKPAAFNQRIPRGLSRGRKVIPNLFRKPHNRISRNSLFFIRT